MLLRCVSNRGSDLPPCVGGYFYSQRTRFDLSIDASYDVYGLGLFGESLLALVVSDNSRPRWFPVALFDVLDGSLPSIWSFAFYDRDGLLGIPLDAGRDIGRWVARWGYEELVASELHNSALMDDDPVAIDIFDRAKRTIDDARTQPGG